MHPALIIFIAVILFGAMVVYPISRDVRIARSHANSGFFATPERRRYMRNTYVINGILVTFMLAMFSFITTIAILSNQ